MEFLGGIDPTKLWMLGVIAFGAVCYFIAMSHQDSR